MQSDLSHKGRGDEERTALPLGYAASAFIST
jgi:hypothetical protein